jgi:hypothetical protein|tara:strand:- start:377 stop:562 length:186 start_codon:yes stop_codon:yes gene_type:complete
MTRRIYPTVLGSPRERVLRCSSLILSLQAKKVMKGLSIKVVNRARSVAAREGEATFCGALF